MKYRPEIDGLRAVAVLPVILFHAGLDAFAGGFVGVDVFFVLSGYLITAILLTELAAGDFSLAKFYERRARRILPALYFVMLVTTLFAPRFMLPDEFAGFRRALVSVLLFGSNLYFWRTTNYFSRAAEENPLLHTWSLGVEEQYYLLFPLVLPVLWRWRLRGATIGIAAATLASLALAEVGWRFAPVASFFLLPTRAWELGLGALAAIYLFERGPEARAPRFGDAAAVLGLGMILASVGLFDAWTPFPGLYALVPTLGTVLLVLFARPDASVGRLLALRPLVFVGLISYGVYLWHQPLFAFARITSTREPGTVQMLGLAALSLALAALTWRFVERPFRDRAFVSAKRLAGCGLSASLGLVALVLVAPGLARTGDGYPPHARQFLATRADRAAYVERGYDALGQAAFTETGSSKLLLIGDSFSQDIYNVIRESGAFDGYQIVTRRVQTVCQIYLGDESVTRFLKPSERAGCVGGPQAADFREIAGQADVIIFALGWRRWSGERIAETVANFGFRDDQRVFVIGRKNFGYFNPRRFPEMAPEALAKLRNAATEDHLTTNAAMRRSVSAGMFVDLHRMLCGARPDCPLFTPEGELISFDGNHLTQAGAKYLGSLLFRDARLAPYAARLTTAAAD